MWFYILRLTASFNCMVYGVIRCCSLDGSLEVSFQIDEQNIVVSSFGLFRLMFTHLFVRLNIKIAIQIDNIQLLQSFLFDFCTFGREKHL